MANDYQYNHFGKLLKAVSTKADHICTICLSNFSARQITLEIEMLMFVFQKIHAKMFRAALFLIDPN